MTTPLVSVCVPTFNGERFLAKTLESVLEQTHPRIEIIVSDDASTDGTRAIIETFRDDRVLVIDGPGGEGAHANWNAACARASGTYLKLLCQDDVLLPRCISAQVGVLEANPRASFVWSPRDVISPGGRRLLRSRGRSPDATVTTLAEAARRIVRSGTNPFGEPCAVLMRKARFDAMPGFHGRYLIDLEMWIDLLRTGPAVHLDDTLSQFRISGDSWTSRLRRHHATQFAELASRLAGEFPDDITRADVAVGTRCAASLQRRRSLLLAMVDVARI